MKSKIVNMKNVKNVEGNYSTMISKLIKPFVEEFPAEMTYDEIIQFTCNAWNMACIGLDVDKEMQNKMHRNAEKIPKIYNDILKKMIEMKKEKFPDYKYLIDNFDIEEKEGEMILSVYTIEEDDYFDKLMNDSINTLMDDLDYEEGYIDRIAIYLKAKQPFLDWRDKVYANEYVYRNYEPTVYLISDEIFEVEKWLKKNYNKIFRQELENWNDDEKTWPQKRSYKMFKQWFNVDFGTMVYDLEKEPIVKGI